MSKTKKTKSFCLMQKKAKLYNQLRNLLVKQFKELAKFHEEWDEEKNQVQPNRRSMNGLS